MINAAVWSAIVTSILLVGLMLAYRNAVSQNSIMLFSDVQFWKRLTTFVFIIPISLSMINCSPIPERFTVELDKSDFIDYGFGGGELGAEWTHIIIHGDGRVMYQHTFPYDGTWPQDEIVIEHQLSLSETQELFQSLVDSGLFDLTDVKTGGADVPSTIITASFDEKNLEVFIEGTPDDAIHGKITDVVSNVHTAAQSMATNLAANTPVSPADSTVPPTLTDSPSTNTPMATTKPTGFIVIGDSASDPYQSVPRGNETSFNWVEILDSIRPVNFGDNLEYIAAVSGNKTEHIDSQITSVESFITNGEIAGVIIWMGANDLNPLCNNSISPSQAETFTQNMISHLESGIQRLLNLEIEAANIYMVDQPNISAVLPCSNSSQFTRIVDNLNAQVKIMQNSYGFNVLNSEDLLTNMASYVINSKGDLQVNGHTIVNQRCDDPTCLYLADRHAGTVLNGLIANTFFVEPLGVSPLSDQEITKAASLD